MSDIYPVNRGLRRGASLETPSSTMLDWEGYETLRQFVDDVDLIFRALGSAIMLDGPLQVFRGIDVPGTPTVYSPDVAGVGAHLTSRAPWHNSFIDLGIGCATTRANVAMHYPDLNHTTVGRQRVPLQLEVHSALCLPRVQHLNAALFEHLVDTTRLHTHVPHLVFPSGTAWEITSIEAHFAHGLPVVHMRQQ